VKARLVTELEVPAFVWDVELAGERILVGTATAVYALDGDRLVPLLEDVTVRGMDGGLVLTPSAIISVDGGASIPLDLDGARPSAFVPLDEGAIVAVDGDLRPEGAAMLRVDRAGVRWRTPVDVPATICGYVSEARRDDNWQIRPARPWQPSQWNTHHGHVCVSGDRVFAVFTDMPRSGIGMGHGFDLATGALVYTTAAAPHGELAAAADPGAFLVGVQGYGAFETRLVDRDGATALVWPSHGKLVPETSPLLLVELENTVPSKSHLATLHGDGSVRRGAHLPGYYTSNILPGGVFWRDDAVVCASPDGARLERLAETPRDGNRPWGRRIAGHIPGRIALSWTSGDRHRLFVYDIA
jgi:hypothetical protein